MALELRQQLKLAQKLVMTQQLRQAIKLLQLNRLELSDALQAEIEQNPALEEDLSPPETLETSFSLSSTIEEKSISLEPEITESFKVSEGLADINWEDYANNFDSNFSFAHETPPADAPSQFDFISEKPGLSAYLHWQLAHSNLDVKEWEIAQYIVGNLNRYGFLEIDLSTVIAETGCTQDEAEYILEVVQELDPPGIGARNVSESLYLQLEGRQSGRGDRSTPPTAPRNPQLQSPGQGNRTKKAGTGTGHQFHHRRTDPVPRPALRHGYHQLCRPRCVCPKGER
jgi:RNA polymerase sigma-54 factor